MEDGSNGDGPRCALFPKADPTWSRPLGLIDSIRRANWKIPVHSLTSRKDVLEEVFRSITMPETA